ncbi:uncharacterized protein KGF55_005430 [Candida pseudojiufengensis]|uniref:uncharacterized protein n=1 Tax=Candida pseudojiufengensis TaxID=497109 RepID=UPI00222560A3|nr:uncharacterized protein KGF55_005430 [Candida pseudojiufengensis]KAI5959280.1 hypothetical protein KGF55_005430 [Candida pseudojiufengensis]
MIRYQIWLILSVLISFSYSSYAPTKVDCPSNSSSFLRVANKISDKEKEWLEGRDDITNQKIVEFLKNANMTDINLDDYSDKNIHIGLAFSGGGYRAMLNGAGQLSALDERTRVEKGHGLPGLLQASTYIAGLSGGSWLVGSVLMNNFTSIQDIVDKNEIWDLTHSIINYGGINVIKTYNYYKGISDDLDDKKDAGFELSLTDTWGRGLSHQFFNTFDNAGASLTFSSLQDTDYFKNYECPMPLIVSNGRAPNTKIISLNSTNIEFNPFEIGSYDKSIYQFMDLKYLGSQLDDGKSNGTCYNGFDNAGFVVGSSSTLFNQFILQINTTSLSSTVKSIISSILQDVSNEENDVAIYKPNPFYETDVGTSEHIAANETLTLVDGGEDGQNVPLYPLLQPARSVDVIFAYDNSADTEYSWPNGTSLIKSYQRQFGDYGNGTFFPYVPDVNTFINLNLTARPTFFGCDAKNLTSLLQIAQSNYTNVTIDSNSIYDSPLLVYTANRPFSYWSNTSTFKMKYDNNERNSIIQNGFEVASRNNGTLDSEWAACVGCAIIRRTQERSGEEQSDQCKKCFERYCWDGSLDSEGTKYNFTDTGTTNGQEETLGGKKNSAVTSFAINWSLWIGLLSIVCFINIQ